MSLRKNVKSINTSKRMLHNKFLYLVKVLHKEKEHEKDSTCSATPSIEAERHSYISFMSLSTLMSYYLFCAFVKAAVFSVKDATKLCSKDSKKLDSESITSRDNSRQNQ